ncbi:hypothetical protein GE09DRAFT_289432 [Coniochaeta sp. 2T2.1]|nr:hypothetical protein GE09DRAFT_289432 [Coniochaeta sp. 2T2.1]
MAVQETEKGTWSDESLDSPGGSSSPSCSDEKSVTTPKSNRLLRASSAAIRSAQQSFGKVSSASVRLYRHSWPNVSSVSIRLHDRWPKVRSRTVRIYHHVSPKLSSASVRLYQRTWPKVSSTANRLYHRQSRPGETSPAISRPPRDRLVATSMSLRFFQLVSALYVFISVTESFRNKITYDGRVRQIQPMMLTTLIYSSVAIVCFLLVNVSNKLKAFAWHKLALVSLPGDVSMICLFIAKDIVFGVHSYECASSQVIVSAVNQYNAVQHMDSLELRSFLENKPTAHPWAISKQSLIHTCLLSSSVYVLCVVAA